MWSFSPSDYGPVVADLVDPLNLQELGPGQPDSAVRSQLSQLQTETLFPNGVADSAMADCCLSGLWLWHNFLEESHSISQDIDSDCGSYWHGIMHRREPDFGNSKYWYRRVGEHPIFQPLHETAAEIVSQSENASSEDDVAFLTQQTQWDPYRFVDLCENAYRGRTGLTELCQQIATVEWQLLFDHCFRHAG